MKMMNNMTCWKNWLGVDDNDENRNSNSVSMMITITTMAEICRPWQQWHPFLQHCRPSSHCDMLGRDLVAPPAPYRCHRPAPPKCLDPIHPTRPNDVCDACLIGRMIHRMILWVHRFWCLSLYHIISRLVMFVIIVYIYILYPLSKSKEEHPKI